MQKFSRVDAYFQETATTLKGKVLSQIEDWTNDVTHFQEEVYSSVSFMLVMLYYSSYAILCYILLYLFDFINISCGRIDDRNACKYGHVCPILPSFLPFFLPSFLRSFLRSFVPSFLPSFLRSFVRSFLPSFVRSFVRSIIPSFFPSFLPSFLLSKLPSILLSFASFPGLLPSFFLFFLLSFPSYLPSHRSQFYFPLTLLSLQSYSLTLHYIHTNRSSHFPIIPPYTINR